MRMMIKKKTMRMRRIERMGSWVRTTRAKMTPMQGGCVGQREREIGVEKQSGRLGGEG